MRFCVLIFCFLLIAFPIPAQAPPDVERFLSPIERAEELLRSDKPAEAVEVLSTYRPSPAEFSVYHAVYARCQVKREHVHDAIQHFRLAYLYATSDADQERLLLERAAAYELLGFHAEAALCYEMFARTFPSSPDAPRARTAIAAAKYRQKQYREAARLYEQLGPAPHARAGMANSLQALGKTAEAHEIYRALIDREHKFLMDESNPASRETLYNIGVNFIEMGKPADALVYLTSVKDGPFAPRAAVHLGRIHLNERKFEKAEKYLSLAAASPVRSVASEALLLKAQSLELQGKAGEAESAYRALYEAYPYGERYDAALLALARIERKRGQSAEAAALLKEMVFRRTPPAEAVAELEALMLDAVKRGGPELPELWGVMGRWLLSPSRSGVLLQVSRGLRASGTPFTELCGWLVRHGSTEAKAECGLQLAVLYAGAGDTARSKGYLDRYQGPRDDQFVRVNATIAMLKNDLGRAAAELLAVKEPSVKDANTVMDALKADAVPFKDAVLFCEKALRKADAPPHTLLRFADILAAAGRARDALTWYRAAAARQAEQGPGALTDAEREWTLYRIASLTKGKESTEALAGLSTGTSAAARIAAADRKGAALRELVPAEAARNNNGRR